MKPEPIASGDTRVQGTRPHTFALTPKLFLSLRTGLLRQQHRRSPKYPNYGTRLINGRPVRSIVSLGTHCLASTTLRNAGLRAWSGPFDWILGSPGMVREMISTDFAAFLPDGDSQAHHRMLDRFGLSSVFVHRDPTTAKDRAHYERCIARFRSVLTSRGATLFLMISRPHHPVESQFETLAAELRRHNPNAELLAIQLRTPRDGITELELAQERDGSRLFNFRPSSAEDKLGYFPDIIDELMVQRLLFHYHLDLDAGARP